MGMGVRGCIWMALLGVLACNRLRQPTAAQPTPAVSPTAAVGWSPSLGLDSLGAVSARLATPFPEPFDVAVVGADGMPKQASMPSCAAYSSSDPKGTNPSHNQTARP